MTEALDFGPPWPPARLRPIGTTARRVDSTPRRARRLQLNSTDVERLRSWSFIDDPHKIGLGQGFGIVD